jgi:hypothetical protein
MGDDERSFYSLSRTQAYIPKACWKGVVRDLKMSDFHLFVDGVEKEIQGFSIERTNILVRDDYGSHYEYSYTPAGKWSTRDIPPRPRSQSVRASRGDAFYYFYNLAFVPQDAAASEPCHQIKVKIDRPHTVAYYRGEYCGRQTPFDILGGTNLGEQMERQIETDEPGVAIPEFQIGSFYAANGSSRVWLSIEFPGDSFGSLARNWEFDNDQWILEASIGILGVIRTRDGLPVKRFSDLGCCSEYSTARLLGATSDLLDIFPVFAGMEHNRIPIRYETQFDLDPGEYELRLIISDGRKFGRIHTGLIVDNFDRTTLALSSIMLGKRIQDARVAAAEVSVAQNFAPQYVPMVAKDIQVAPAGATSFKATDKMYCYFEVYAPKLVSSSSAVQVHLRISDATTGAVIQELGSVDATTYMNLGSTTIPISRKIPFESLPKGLFHFEVQATDSSVQSTPWHTVSFTVE